ncbi:hypothetical protein K474DRAFT_1714339 [Panus rudis PR-1116 ss-1]|nr:hypothetical protein K474DRAFT_1714339 [Panus rudis PR-1116 ss-1]
MALSILDILQKNKLCLLICSELTNTDVASLSQLCNQSRNLVASILFNTFQIKGNPFEDRRDSVEWQRKARQILYRAGPAIFDLEKKYGFRSETIRFKYLWLPIDWMANLIEEEALRSARNLYLQDVVIHGEIWAAGRGSRTWEWMALIEAHGKYEIIFVVVLSNNWNNY